jgi:hypothetical protein
LWPHSAGLSAAVHPWRLTEKACPNEAIVARRSWSGRGLKGLAALKAAGLFDNFDKPAVNTPAVNSTSTDRKAYQRDYMRKRRRPSAPAHRTHQRATVGQGRAV